MRARSFVPICIAVVVALLVAVSPAVAEENDPQQVSVMAARADSSAIRVDAPPWARRGAAQLESTPADYRCKPALTMTGEIAIHEPEDPEHCTYEGELYYWCGDRPVTGTLTGTYYYYSRPYDNGWELEVPLTEMDPSWWMGASYILAVFDTNKGMLFAQECEVWHAEDPIGWAASYAITGGTGQYEGATGFMRWAGTYYDGLITGEICTPIEQ